MSGKVLLIDDDTSVTKVVGMALELEGYQVEVANSGVEGLRRLYQTHPDLVILDVMMPSMDGWETCRRIREVSDVPIMMLTAKDGEASELRGLKVGADQYAIKPLAIPLLVARVQALLKRTNGSSHSSQKRLIEVGDITVDLARQQASLGGSPLELSPTEFRLLACLASRPGEVIPRAELLTQVWGPEYRDEDMYLKLYVLYLRQKIEEDPSNPTHIITRRGVGYYLNDSPETSAPSQPLASSN